MIPHWLIEMTGDPNRLIKIGPLINQEKTILEISFDQLQFPACRTCNEQFGILEGTTKPIVENLMSLEKVPAQSFDFLLDWFDKVRIGLWLGYHQLLDKNFWQITPNFHIADRIGSKDRALIIYRSQYRNNRINFTGVNTPAFAHSPTCFTLIINNLYFTNISTDFLLAKHSGLPYPRVVFINNENQIGIQTPLESGTGKFDYPILGYNYDKRSTVIAQPIFQRYISSSPKEYEANFIQEISLQSGKSKPLIQRLNSVSIYPSMPTLDWLPDEIHDSGWLLDKVFAQTLQLQIDLLMKLYISREESKAERQILRYNLNQCITENKNLITEAARKRGT